MAELRALSTRARITPTQLQNVYHHFMLRLPRRLLDPEAAQPYAVEGFLDVGARAWAGSSAVGARAIRSPQVRASPAVKATSA